MSTGSKSGETKDSIPPLMKYLFVMNNSNEEYLFEGILVGRCGQC